MFFVKKFHRKWEKFPPFFYGKLNFPIINFPKSKFPSSFPVIFPVILVSVITVRTVCVGGVQIISPVANQMRIVCVAASATGRAGSRGSGRTAPGCPVPSPSRTPPPAPATGLLEGVIGQGEERRGTEPSAHTRSLGEGIVPEESQYPRLPLFADVLRFLGFCIFQISFGNFLRSVHDMYFQQFSYTFNGAEKLVLKRDSFL